VSRYRARLSGPLLDRIDMTLDVPALSAVELQGAATGESSTHVQARVIAARTRQIDRQGKSSAALSAKEIDRWCAPDDAAARLPSAALARLKLSARAYHRVLKLARTVADLAANDTIASAHVAEAIHYRRNLGDN
jgi:magnesium chelatase family protein